MKTIVAVFIAVAWLACGAAGAAEDDFRLPGIKGKDNRVVMDSKAFPWRAIGRLNDSQGGHCTAAIVGSRLVLTAAHCLMNPRTGTLLAASSLHFLAGWSKETYLVHARGKELVVAPGFVAGRPREIGNQINFDNKANDWALVTLDRDVAKDIGRFDVVPLDGKSLADLKRQGKSFVLAGYPQDRAEVLMADVGCPLDGIDKTYALVVHSCDAVGGASGGPIFYRDGDTYRIVALHVATLGRKDKEALGIAVPGSAFADAVKRAGP